MTRTLLDQEQPGYRIENTVTTRTWMNYVLHYVALKELCMLHICAVLSQVVGSQ